MLICVQDLEIGAQFRLPACTVVRLPDKGKRVVLKIHADDRTIVLAIPVTRRKRPGARKTLDIPRERE